MTTFQCDDCHAVLEDFASECPGCGAKGRCYTLTDEDSARIREARPTDKAIIIGRGNGIAVYGRVQREVIEGAIKRCNAEVR